MTVGIFQGITMTIPRFTLTEDQKVQIAAGVTSTLDAFFIRYGMTSPQKYQVAELAQRLTEAVTPAIASLYEAHAKAHAAKEEPPKD